MVSATVDLDDTLIETRRDYERAKMLAGNLVENQTGVPPEKLIERIESVDRGRVDSEGLSMDRFPTSLRMATDDMVSDPSAELLDRVEQIGYSTFVNEHVYEARGLMEGAREFLDWASEEFRTLHLVTVGDPRAQEPKIRGLSLSKWFDEVHICSYHNDTGHEKSKTPYIQQAGDDGERVYHIGNSASSDVEAALEAGVNAVHIPSGRTDWLTEMNGNSVGEQSSVYEFECLSEVPDNIPL